MGRFLVCTPKLQDSQACLGPCPFTFILGSRRAYKLRAHESCSGQDASTGSRPSAISQELLHIAESTGNRQLLEGISRPRGHIWVQSSCLSVTDSSAKRSDSFLLPRWHKATGRAAVERRDTSVQTQNPEGRCESFTNVTDPQTCMRTYEDEDRPVWRESSGYETIDCLSLQMPTHE